MSRDEEGYLGTGRMSRDEVECFRTTTMFVTKRNIYTRGEVFLDEDECVGTRGCFGSERNVSGRVVCLGQRINFRDEKDVSGEEECFEIRKIFSGRGGFRDTEDVSGVRKCFTLRRMFRVVVLWGRVIFNTRRMVRTRWKVFEQEGWLRTKRNVSGQVRCIWLNIR